MTLKWNEETISWYINANEYTGFYRNVANAVTPMLSGYKSLCDMGCGLGLVDLELYKIMERIDCIDINSDVVGSLNKSIEKRNIKNIYTRVADCENIEGAWDVIYMSFFGSRNLDKYMSLCKKLIVVVGEKAKTHLFPAKYRNFNKNTVDNTEKYLMEKGISYELTQKEFEFGQPFESVDEARKFILSLAKESTKQEIDEFLANRLVSIRHPVYSCFIPRKKPIGIFELKGML